MSSPMDRMAWPAAKGMVSRLIRESDFGGTPLASSEFWSGQLRTIVDLVLNAPLPMAVLWSERRLQIYNDAMAAHIPARHAKALGRPAAEGWGEDWNRLVPLCESASEGRAIQADIELGGRHPSRFEATASPLHGEHGEVVGLLLTLRPRRARRNDVADGSDGLLAFAYDRLPHPVWRAGLDGAWTWTSKAWSRLTGLTGLESRGIGWQEAVHPDDRLELLQRWRKACGAPGRAASLSAVYRLFDAEKNDYRFSMIWAAPMVDARGELCEWLGGAMDVDHLEREHLRQQTHLSELQRQIRNSLAVMRSIIRRSAETSSSIEDYALHLDGRIASFARIQAKLMRVPDLAIDLEELVADELSAHAAFDDRHFNLFGPPLRLRAKLAESLGLALHELATNAVKFGALATPQGRIDVHWEIRRPIQEDGTVPVLMLIWDETTSRTVDDTPKERGFGMTLIEDTLTFEFNASTQFDFLPRGLRCTMIIPLTRWIVHDLRALMGSEACQGRE